MIDESQRPTAGGAVDPSPPGPTAGGPVDPSPPGELGSPVYRVAVVTGVRMDLPSQYPEVTLQEAEAPWRELRLPVGLAEGTAIAYGWRGIETPRPLTHQLVVDLLDRHNVRIETVRITARRGGTYLAELDTSGPRGRQVVPCRPSDAIALVLRAALPIPIMVAEGLFSAEHLPPVGPARP